jgi:hypothetical protein
MFKTILALAWFVVLSGSAFAACSNPLIVKDGNQAFQNMSVSANPLDVNCQYNMALGSLSNGAGGGWQKTLFAAISTTVQTVKSSGGQIGKLYCDNPNSSAIYVETFDVSGTVTLGTTAPTQAYMIPALNAGGFALALIGDQYGNAIKIAAVTSVNGTTAPTTPGNCNVSWN